MLFFLLVAGPDEVLFGRKGLAVLHDPKFSLGDMTDHSVHHHLIFGSLRTRLNDDVTQRDSLEAGDYGWSLAIDTVHDTRRHFRVLIVRGLRSGRLHHSARRGCHPNSHMLSSSDLCVSAPPIYLIR